MSLALSETSIKTTEPPAKGARILSDGHRDAPRGFGLKVTAAGGKSFILRYRAKDTGRDRLLTIGSWPTWSLAAARKQAEQFKRDIDAGRDIIEERRQERERPLLGSVVDAFCTSMTDHLKSGRVVRNTLNKHFVQPLGVRKPFVEITRREVREAVKRVSESAPCQAGKLLGYIKQVFAWAEDEELIPVSPVATLKAEKVSKEIAPKNFQRGRVLSEDEIRGLWGAEAAGMYPLTALALRMILVTGQRPGEVTGMRWEEVSGNVWTIPASRRGKTKTAHAVPLTTTALEILAAARQESERLSRKRGHDLDGAVFESRPGGLGPNVVVIGRSVKLFADRIRNQDHELWGHWRPHDLRRTCRTGLSACRIPDHIAELAIGHGRKGIAAVYDLHSYEREKREALEAWERRLQRIVEGKPADDNVVPLRAEVPA